MKKIFLLISMLTMGLAVQAQSSLDNRLMFKTKVYNQHNSSALKSKAVLADQPLTVIGTLKDGLECPTQELEALGVKVISEVYGLVVMQTSIDKLEALGNVKAFSEVSQNDKPEMKCDKSRILTHVTDVQDANNLPEGLKQTYTGKGVFLGIVDGGFDFQHKNFKDANGNMRFNRVWLLDGETALKEVSSAEEIAALTTDTDTGSHGSHTLGTAAGSYDGEYTLSNGTKISGFRGSAYEADILACALGTEVNTFLGISNMWEYARSQKKPLIISLSIGASDAWMDGKNTYTTFFKNITKGGTQDSLLINLAAGNEGWEKKYFRKELKVGEKIAMHVTFSSADFSEISLASDDATPFDVTLYGYDASGNIAHTYKLDQQDGTMHDICSNLGYITGYNSNHDGRFYYEIGCNSPFQKIDADYVLEISAADKPCVVRTAFSHCNCSNKLNGVVNAALYDPTDDNSLSNWVQHKYAFAVGAYTSRVSYPLYDGRTYGTESHALFGDHKPCTLYDIAPFSSWVDIPYNNNTDSIGVDFLAPGNVVLSSINHYEAANTEYCVAKADDNNLLGAMYGTSMATPNASGIMALWLQACPSLSVSKVREIIKQTADNDDFTRANPRRAGAGKLNCLAGLQLILKDSAAGITNINADITHKLSISRKYLDNGRIVIQKSGHKYNALGQSL